MKARVILAALALGLGCATGGAPEATAAAGDACRLPPSPADEATCGGAPLCTPRERAGIACELRDAIAARYVFFTEKGRLLAAAGRPGLDPRRHLEVCVEAERAAGAERDPLAFYDRMRRCVAAFEDGHLLLRVPGGLPPVALGLALRRTGDGAVRVAARASGLAALLEARDGAAGLAAAALLAPGAEVVAVDGRPVAEAVAELAALVPGGSPAARDARAVDALARRDFAYPDRAQAVLTLATGDAHREVALPWWTSPGAERHALAGERLRRAGATATDRLDWREPRATWAGPPAAVGLRAGDPILPPAEAATLVELAGDDGLVAARLGEVTAGDAAPYCYGQLLTFHTETLAVAGAARAFPEVLEEFVRGCGARGLDLVLDLRRNEGGYLSHSTALAAMLLARGGSGPGGALLVRASDHNEQVYRDRAPFLEGLPGWPRRWRSEPERVLDAIRAARSAREEFAPALLDGPLHPAEDGGFDGRIVVLTSPGCMSACERLAGLLRRSGRATLVGGPTEGAGGSQQETRRRPARWTDRRGRLSVSIPNAAMGLQRGDTEGDTSAARFFEALALENRPVEPEVPYATTAEDLVAHARGWRALAEEALRAGGPLAR